MHEDVPRRNSWRSLVSPSTTARVETKLWAWHCPFVFSSEPPPRTRLSRHPGLTPGPTRSRPRIVVETGRDLDRAWHAGTALLEATEGGLTDGSRGARLSDARDFPSRRSCREFAPSQTVRRRNSNSPRTKRWAGSNPNEAWLKTRGGHAALPSPCRGPGSERPSGSRRPPCESHQLPRVAQDKNVEREKGFEPSTSTLARWHSTTELLPQTPRPFSGPMRGFV